MATAITLAQAAGQAYDNLHIHALADQLGGEEGRIAMFCRRALAIVPECLEGGKPLSNWLAVFHAHGASLPESVPIEQLTEAAQILYRLCWMAYSLTGRGITTAQAAQLLAQYNAILGC